MIPDTMTCLPSPAAVVDYALTLAGPQRCRHMVSALGRYARWNPQLLQRAHNEAVRRSNLYINRGVLNWQDRQRYNGVVNALVLAADRAIGGPPRRRGM
jgi:hypothetical protein